MKLEFSPQIFEIKNIQVGNFMKIRPVGAELFHAGGRTGMLKLIVAFRHFANAPERQSAVAYCVSHSYGVCVWALTGNEEGTREERARTHCHTHTSFTWFQGTKYSHAPHNDISVNDGPHIRRWSHKIVI
jgi:hypothetical protein